MPIPNYILQNDFLLNLGDDFVAVDLAGHIVGRAATQEALLRAHAEGSVKLYSATDFADAPEEPAPVVEEAAPVIAATDNVVTPTPTRRKSRGRSRRG